MQVIQDFMAMIDVANVVACVMNNLACFIYSLFFQSKRLSYHLVSAPEEEMAVGSIGWSTYLNYFKAGGAYLFTSFTALMFLLGEVRTSNTYILCMFLLYVTYCRINRKCWTRYYL